MTKRRQFLKEVLYTGTGLAVANKSLFANTFQKRNFSLKYKIDNPYARVDWEKDLQIASTSHIHIETQKELDRAYAECNYRHLPISNYYPSAPYYPANTVYENQFRVAQNFEVQFDSSMAKETEGFRSAWINADKWKYAICVKPPINWNEIITDEKNGWYQLLPDTQKKQLPFKKGNRVFSHIPSDLIISPNAEQHHFVNTSSDTHINSLGSLYSSGTFDKHNLFGTVWHGYSFGNGLPWEAVFTKILNNLLFKDAGGITINHPSWSHMTYEEVCSLLDFDHRVLGLEIYTDGCDTPEEGWSINIWDRVLKSGRKAFGFCVPDHMVEGIVRGRNMLIIPEFTEYACLRAYRTGAFFGAILGNGLAFKQIHLDGNRLTVKINKSGTIRVILNGEEKQCIDAANALEYILPGFAENKTNVNYIRIEASDETGEQIFQPADTFYR